MSEPSVRLDDDLLPAPEGPAQPLESSRFGRSLAFHEGDPLQLYWIDDRDGVHEELLASNAPNSRLVCVVPAGCWQAAKPRGEYSLVGCTVGPGFDFQDFEMIAPGSAALAQVMALNAAFGEFV